MVMNVSRGRLLVAANILLLFIPQHTLLLLQHARGVGLLFKHQINCENKYIDIS